MGILKRISGLLSLGMLVAGLTMTMGGTAQAVPVPDPTWNEIISAFDNAQSNPECVDSPRENTSAGAPLQLFRCHATDSGGQPQRWHFQAMGNGFQISNFSSGLCIGIGQDLPANGNHAVQANCSFNTVWDMVGQAGSGSLFHLQYERLGTSVCLEPADLSDSNGTPLVIKSCDPTFSHDLAQLWSLG